MVLSKAELVDIIVPLSAALRYLRTERLREELDDALGVIR
jgi:hypothetical protein